MGGQEDFRGNIHRKGKRDPVLQPLNDHSNRKRRRPPLPQVPARKKVAEEKKERKYLRRNSGDEYLKARKDCRQ